jgi:outer membrane protein OmpA-like peptidoglycan-associated protein
VLALALAAAGGCARPVLAPPAAPADLVVLLPAREGPTGALSVSRGAEQQVLSAPYASARVAPAGPIDMGATTPAEVERLFGEALSALPSRPMSVLLYFLEGKDELTPDSRQVVDRVVAEIAGRPAAEVVVIGHTDRVGSVAFNDALSLRRAQRVRDDLVRLGVGADRIEVAGRGEREPLVPTEDEVAEPRNRRVEISVR